MTTYRTAGAWGAGKGSRLTPAEVDTNFYGHETRIATIEANPGARGVSVSNIAVNGSQVVFYLEDGTQFGPFNLPYAAFTDRGEWAANTAYSALDFVNVPSVGLVLVLQDHTSDATFDEDASNSGGDIYRVVVRLLSPAAIKTVSAATYEPGPDDDGKYIRYTNPGGCIIVLTGGLRDNAEVHHRQVGGALSFTVGDTGGSIFGRQGKDEATNAIGAVATTKHLGSGDWDLFGDLAEAT